MLVASRVQLRAAAALGATLAIGLGCGEPSPVADPAGEPPVLSLLALGDTGKRHRWFADWTEGQIAVAQGMAAEDRRRPVDGLVLLGDNFYMSGLEAHELVARVRQNVVVPYCHFLDLSGPRSSEVAGGCAEPADERHPVPVYSVLGNHDLISPDSPRLQREVVPELVANWQQSGEEADVQELAGGVSLILLRTDEAMKRSPRVLTEALRASRGPFRIVAGHRPAAIEDSGAPAPDESYYRNVREASRLAGVPIHLFLSGHHHSLQLIELDAPAPRLNVVAGSGSRWRPIRMPHPRRRFELESLGFARVDLVGRGEQARLVASLFATATYPALNARAPELVARWSVDRNGRLRDELAPPGPARP